MAADDLGEQADQPRSADPAGGGSAPPAARPDPGAPVESTDFHESSLFRWQGKSSVLAGAMFALLGLLLVAGVQAYGGADALANARPSDLVQILDSLDSENDRLEAEKARLRAELDSLTSGTDAEALAQARNRRDSLEVLAGTTAVSGPGVRIVIRDPGGGVGATDILDAVQELRDAGAESIEVAQRRVVVNTWFADPGEGQGPGILISGDLRSSPYTILAIGDPETLATAMEIPGGVADTVRTAGAEYSVDKREKVEITSTVPLVIPDYAEPVDTN